MTGEQVAFYLSAALVLGGAVVTITRRNTVSAVMALVFTFFGLAAVYTLLSAHFLAAVQVLVYAGAIMTLFVFVVMVLNRDEQEPWALRGIVSKAVGLAGGAYLLVLVVAVSAGASAVLKANGALHAGAPPSGFGGVAEVGTVLFTTYLFPFEAVSLLLLVAVIGAVVVARTHRHQSPADRAQAAELPDGDAAALPAGDSHP